MGDDQARVWRWVLLLYILGMVVGSGIWGERPSRLWAQARVLPQAVAVSPGTGQATNASRILLQNYRLSVDVRNQELHTILRTIATQGDINIRRLDEVPNKRISIRFTDLPLVTGLQRLFRAAEVYSYVLVTAPQGDEISVQRILFLAAAEDRRATPTRSRVVRRPVAQPAPQPAPQPAVQPPAEPPASQPQGSEQSESRTEENGTGSVFEELKTNTTARRLLSQLVHPNEQVRDRALERLIQLVGDDEKQAEMMEFLEPLLEELASEDQTQREEARQEIRKLLSR
jgi:hypothetical protein